MAGEKNDDITGSRYRYFIVDTGTFTGGCPDSIMESDYFSGKRGMILDRGECAPDLLWKNAKGGNNSSAFAGTGISHYESAAEKYRCPSKTF